MGYIKHWVVSAALILVVLPGGVLASPVENEQEEEAATGILLDSVVVTATRTEKTAFDTPASVSVLDDEQILQEQGTTLRDILEDLPNVDFSSGTSTFFQVPSLRGLEDEQTIIKIDGAKQHYNDNAGNARAPVLIDPLLLKQVEVVRGPSSTLHGSGGIGGVIALRTKDAQDMLKPGHTVGATFKVGHQSVNSQEYASAMGYAGDDLFGLLASITTRDFGHLWTSSPAGYHVVPSTGYSSTRFLKASVTPNNGQYFALSFNDFRDRFDIEGGSWYSSKQRQVTANYDLTPESQWLDMHASAQYTWRKNESDTQMFIFDDTFDSWNFDLQNTFRFDTGEWMGHALTVGGDYGLNHQKGNRNGVPDSSRPKATGWDLGMFIQDEISLPAGVSLIPALRYTRYHRAPDSGFAPAQDMARVTPKITARWQALDWLNLFATYAESFRPPSLNEIYFAMQFPAGAVLPNPDLKPESAKTWEYGMGLSFDSVFTQNDPLRFKLVYFREVMKDFMKPVFLGGAPPNMHWTTVNADKVHRFGYEAEFSYTLDRYTMGVTYGKVMGINRETGGRVGQTPEVLGVRLGCDIKEYDLALGWKSQFTAESKGYRPWKSDTSTVPAHNVHGLYVTWTPEDLWGYDGFRLDFGVDNLFDKKYLSYRGGYERGRNIKLGVTCSF